MQKVNKRRHGHRTSSAVGARRRRLLEPRADGGASDDQVHTGDSASSPSTTVFGSPRSLGQAVAPVDAEGKRRPRSRGRWGVLDGIELERVSETTIATVVFTVAGKSLVTSAVPSSLQFTL